MTYVIEMLVLNASSSDPDQTLRSAASDLCLHCLLILFFGGVRYKWVTLEKSTNFVFAFFQRQINHQDAFSKCYPNCLGCPCGSVLCQLRLLSLLRRSRQIGRN